ncbi:MAG TPA: hypothetical protein VNZ45_09730 [Bacteroidia bacterium]|nr:hypothetical protein [Bacteroidia bacterium]
MKSYRTFFVILFFSFSSLINSRAQDVLTQMQNGVDVNVLYKYQALGGLFIHSEGWGAFFRKAKILSIYRKWFWEVETATMHNAKETMIQNSYYPDAKGYYYGKMNGVQIFRFGTGISKMIWRKNNERCVEIDAVYAGGLSIAVTKPIYLEIIQPTPNSEFLLEDVQYDPSQDTPANIYGRASVFDGLGQLSFYPGLYGRLGLNFDYANKHNLVKAIETGIEVDAYPKVIPIMAYVKNSQVFLNLYLSLSIGKRWF